MSRNYRKIYAMNQGYREQLLKLNPKLNDRPGIYFLLRENEEHFKFAYIGQTRQGILSRMVSHMHGYSQHIDLSLRKHKLWSEDNPYGWRVEFINCPVSKLDDLEKHYIKLYADAGYQLRNSSLGGQGANRASGEINERKSPKTYMQGVERGYVKASKEISHLFDLHLKVSKKSDRPNKNQDKALEKFQAFLDYHKLKEGSEENET